MNWNYLRRAGAALLMLTFISISVSFALPATAEAYVSVKGYYKSNGTYVAPYVRSNPNGLKYDNYGYKPSQGLYNKTYGTRGAAWDTPTYITDPDYYVGQSLYNSKTTSSSNSKATAKLKAAKKAKDACKAITKEWKSIESKQKSLERKQDKIEAKYGYASSHSRELTSKQADLAIQSMGIMSNYYSCI